MVYSLYLNYKWTTSEHDKKINLYFYVYIVKGDYVAIGASGGKDSTVLAYIMKTLNQRYDYGLKLVLLSIGNIKRNLNRKICRKLIHNFTGF